MWPALRELTVRDRWHTHRGRGTSSWGAAARRPEGEVTAPSPGAAERLSSGRALCLLPPDAQEQSVSSSVTTVPQQPEQCPPHNKADTQKIPAERTNGSNNTDTAGSSNTGKGQRVKRWLALDIHSTRSA